MNKLVLQIFMSLDGYAAGPNGEFLAPAYTQDLATHWSGYANERARHVLYGANSFVFNKKFWSDPASPGANMPQASFMNRVPKTVASSSLPADPGWNAKTQSGDLKTIVADLKRYAEGDIYVFGGVKLARSLIAAGVVDEYRLLVLPKLLGQGQTIFQTGFAEQQFERIAVTPLDTGAVILHYGRKASR
jgi:dihydrofolate reductase